MLRSAIVSVLLPLSIGAALLLSSAPAGVADAASQTISFPSITTKTFGGAPFLINPTASSGLSVSLVANTPAVCTLTGNALSAVGDTESVNLVGAGTCSITASQAGSLPAWSAATPVTRIFTVKKANQTITFGAIANTAFGAAPFNVDATASSGLPVSLASFTTSVCSLAVVDIDTWQVTILTAGSCYLRATQAGDANYNAASGVSRSFSVAKGLVTVTADAASRPYGAPNPTITADVTGLATGPANDVASGSTVAGLSGTLTCSTAASSIGPVGTYSIWCSGLFSQNYNISYVKALLTVTPINQTITFAPIADRVYGDAAFTVSPTSDSGLFVTLSATGPCTVPNGSFFGPVTITGVGSCTITANQAGNGNYNAAAPVPQIFDIDPAALTVTADNKFGQVGQAVPAFTVTASGYKYFDNSQNTPLTGTLSCSVAPPVSNPLVLADVGSHTIDCSASTLSAGPNYTIGSYVTGTLTVNP